MNAQGIEGGIPAGIQSFLEAAGDWAFLVDRDNIIRYCHKSADAWGNHTPKALLGKSFLKFIPPAARSAVNAFLTDRRAPGAGRRSILYEDGGQGSCMLQMVSVAGSDGPSRYIVVQQAPARHIHEEPPGDEELRQRRQQNLIAELSADFAGSRDGSGAIGRALKRLGEFLQVDRCAVYRYHRREKLYQCLYEWRSANAPHRPEDARDARFHAEEELLRGDAIAGEDPSDEDVRAFADLPILVRSRTWGYLGVEAGRGVRHWQDSEMRLLHTVNNVITAAIERQSMRQELSATIARLEAVVHAYPGVIWCLDNDRRFTLFDGRSAAGVLPYPPEEILGSELLDKNNAVSDTLIYYAQKTFEEGPQSYLYEKEGRALACETSPLVNHEGVVSGVMGVSLDVTEMTTMQRRLESAIDDAQRAGSAKSDFLSRMSHEIRTPMNAVIGMTSIALKSEDPDKIRYCLGKIENASRQLLGIINDILDISKIEAGKFDITPAEFDFERMLQSACGIIEAQVGEKRQNLSIRMESMFERGVICDELRLSQVITNLLTNAVKFTPAGGDIILSVRHRPKEGEAGRFLLRVEVEDNGIGISPDKVSRLFSTFEQGDGTITRRYGGTGLGLAICKNIVNLMGGEIWVDSEPDRGSRFSFEVEFGWGEELRREGPKSPRKDLRILVVDDSEDVRLFFGSILAGFGMSCDIAASGGEALEMVRAAMAADRPYELVFIDWRMPGKSGVETVREVRSLMADNVIVVMISVADWSDIEKEAGPAGINRFLSKPVLPSVLFNTITELTGCPVVEGEPDAVARLYDWTGRRVLLAEDIEINREIVLSILEDTGLEIDCAVDGRQAVELCKKDPERYDLILMDIQMPEMDGLAATRAIRALGGRAAGLPILAMTANALREDVDACLAAGMDGHLAKPLNVDDLMEQLFLYLDENRTVF